MIIEGKNPVAEALSAGKTIEKLYVVKGNFEATVNRIVQMAKAAKVPTIFTSKDTLDKLSPSGKHQGVVAYATEFEYASMDDVYDLAKKKGEPLFVVILDGITDPHNLGSIIRSAECVGAHGVIIPQRRAVGVSETVVKVSAGATEHVNVVKVTNVNDTIRELKDRGVYVFSTAMDGEPIYKANLTGDVAIVIGSEGDGVKRLTKELSDGVISIPQYGKLNSLNAGVAAGIVMFEKARQEKFGK